MRWGNSWEIERQALNVEREYVEDYSTWLRQEVGGKFGRAADALWQSMDMVIPDFKKLQWLSYRLRDLVDAYEEATCGE